MKPWLFLFIVLLAALFSGCASAPEPVSQNTAGNITNRVWHNPTNGMDRIQTLSWDARGRLHAVTERDASNSGYNWTATYDGLNRRLSTTSVLVSNGVAFTSSPTTINSYYDPQVEFLELGVNYGSTTEWKLYGPDLNGVYGGMNGVGGLDAVSPILNLFEPVVSDERGNILAVETNSSVVWNPARPTGYGAIPGYLPLPLANGANLSSASAWRGRWADITGYYNVGLRPYDPVSGRWLTFDSVWNDLDPSGMTFCGGDPINRMDADGRMSANNYNQNPTMGLGNDNGTQNLYFGIAQQMQTYLQTTIGFQDGTSATTGLPGQAPLVYDESQVGGRYYNAVTMPTGQYGFYVSPTPLPDDYGQITTTPITTWDVQAQNEKQFLFGLATIAATVMTDTEEAAPDLLAAESGQVAFNVQRTADGVITISHPENADAFIMGQVSGQNLNILNVNVPAAMRQQGLSAQLYGALVNQAGDVESISGELMHVNQNVLQDLMDNGYSVQAAAAGTPAASARSAAGFSVHTYDPTTGILNSTRP